MTKHYFRLAVLAAALSAAGCAGKKQPELDYYTPGAKGGNPLEVPPDLTGLSSSDRYTIPAGSGAVRASQVEGKGTAVAAGTENVLPQMENLKIHREGSQRWLEIGGKTPAQIWPQLKAFWLENGFTIDEENPAIGFMQTQWAENRANIPSDPLRNLFQRVGLGGVYSSGLRDRFLIRVERTDNGASVTFSHHGVQEVLVGSHKDSSKWEPRPNDPNLEAQFLARFMLKMGADDATVQQQLLVQGEGSGHLAQLDNGILTVSGSHERNVHRLSLALDRIGLTVQNFDAAANAFTVRQAEMESENPDKPGFFSRVFGKDKKAEPKSERPRLQVRITPAADNVDKVTVHNLDGTPYNARIGEEILRRLWAELR